MLSPQPHRGHPVSFVLSHQKVPRAVVSGEEKLGAEGVYGDSFCNPIEYVL